MKGRPGGELVGNVRITVSGLNVQLQLTPQVPHRLLAVEPNLFISQRKSLISPNLLP